MVLEHLLWEHLIINTILLFVLEMADECVPAAEHQPTSSDHLLTLPLGNLCRSRDAIVGGKTRWNAAADEFVVWEVSRNVALEVGATVVLLDVGAVRAAPTFAALGRELNPLCV